jgi:hypothetical protein
VIDSLTIFRAAIRKSVYRQSERSKVSIDCKDAKDSIVRESVSANRSMSSGTLVQPEATFRVPALQAISKWSLFQDNPAAVTWYKVRSSVSFALFQQFACAIDGNPIEIASPDFSGLSQLSEEFGIHGLRSQLSEFTPVPESENPKVGLRQSHSTNDVAALGDTFKLDNLSFA